MAPRRRAKARRPQPLEHRILLTATLCLLAFGAVMVYSASSATTLLQGQGNGSGYLVRYVVYGGVGLVAMRVLARDGRGESAPDHRAAARRLVRAACWRCTSRTSASGQRRAALDRRRASSSSSRPSC